MCVSKRPYTHVCPHMSLYVSLYTCILAQALEGRKEKVAAVCATVERELECVGASAVEDQLQDEV